MGAEPGYDVVFHIPVKDECEDGAKGPFGLKCVTTSVALCEEKVVL
jgi:hypothetical protein